MENNKHKTSERKPIVSNGCKPIPRKPKEDKSFLEVQGKEAILSSVINLCVKEKKPKIPDGGWGWLVILASLYINLVADGVSGTFGLLFIQFLNAFGASKSTTSWIGSLFVAVPLLAGPLCSALVDRYGNRKMTIVGGIICTLGFALSAYSQSIVTMMITFGFIGGIGLGLCYVTAVVCIMFWFEKRRTLALGLAASGTGFGTIIYSPLLTYLLNEYGWRGALLILAGLFANICVAGCFMRDPLWICNKMKNNDEETQTKISRPKKKKKPAEFIVENLEASISIPNKQKWQSAVDLPTFLRQNNEVSVEILHSIQHSRHFHGKVIENSKNLQVKSISDTELENQSQEDIPLKFCMVVKEADSESTLENEVHKDDEYDQKDKLLRSISVKSKTSQHTQHSHHQGYLGNIRVRKNSIGYRGAVINIHKYKLVESSSCPDIFKNSVESLEDDDDEEWYDEYVDVLKDLTHFSLFLDFHFFLMSLSTILMCVWFIVPYFYLADHMISHGYNEDQVSAIFSTIGVTNIIGMVFLAWIGKKINAAKVYSWCLVVCGITCGAMMYFTDVFPLLVASSAMFGLFFSSCYSLTPAILAELVPIEKFTMAYGLSLLCQGIGNLTGPPIAGLIFDLTKSYDQSFYQASFWIIISGVLVGAIPYTKNRIIFGFLRDIRFNIFNK